jgi:putative membrane protein
MVGAAWWGLGALMMVFCMVMMVSMIGRMGHGHSGHGWHTWQDERGDPERTLADRLARGEIDQEEYHRLLETLRGADHSPRA